MQVLCKASETASDIKCSVCGQGFQVYWERTNVAEREAARVEILAALQAQHQNATGVQVHPTECFNLPNWNGSPRYSAAAILGNAPSSAWAL